MFVPIVRGPASDYSAIKTLDEAHDDDAAD
jgi:hypothetical protein